MHRARCARNLTAVGSAPDGGDMQWRATRPMSCEPEHRAATAIDTGTVDVEAMTRALARFLEAAGLPAAASGDAPARASAAWVESLLCGYDKEPIELLRPTWPEPSGDLVAVTRIPFVSVCEHHLLPFFGLAHVAYLPDQELTGLSRLEEMVFALSRRLQLQERLGEEICETLMHGVAARGAACILDAEHLCVFARGRRRRGTLTRSVAFAGDLSTDHRLQDRCLTLLSGAGAAAIGEESSDE